MKPFLTALALTLLLLLPAAVQAQEQTIGLFNSPKGFGITADFDMKHNSFQQATLYADMYGIYSSRNSVPGIKANYSRMYLFNVIRKEQLDYLFYLGGGVTLGYVKDYETGSAPLVNNFGVVAALSAKFGCSFFFHRNVVLNLGLMAEAGIHVRKNENGTNLLLNFYKNGIIYTMYPELSILFKF